MDDSSSKKWLKVAGVMGAAALAGYAGTRLLSVINRTTHSTPEVYSPVGMEWIEKNSMGTVLLRHYPRLAPALRGVKNPFVPWLRVKA